MLTIVNLFVNKIVFGQSEDFLLTIHAISGKKLDHLKYFSETYPAMQLDCAI